VKRGKKTAARGNEEKGNWVERDHVNDRSRWANGAPRALALEAALQKNAADTAEAAKRRETPTHREVDEAEVEEGSRAIVSVAINAIGNNASPNRNAQRHTAKRARCLTSLGRIVAASGHQKATTAAQSE